MLRYCLFFFFFFNDTATTEIYTLSLHDALPISYLLLRVPHRRKEGTDVRVLAERVLDSPDEPGPGIHDLAGPVAPRGEDRKSTRLNSSHVRISYAVFCLKKKKKKPTAQLPSRKK